MKSNIKLFLPLFFIGFFIIGCEPDGPRPTDLITIQEVVESGGVVETQSEFENTSTLSYDSLIVDEIWTCRSEFISISNNFDDFPNFSPNSEFLIPGRLIQGNSIGKATPEVVPVRRGPGVVFIDLYNGSEGVRRELDEASPSLTLEAINEIISSQSGTIPANFNTGKEIIRAKEQLELELKAKASILGVFNVNLYTNWSNDEEYSRMLVTLDEIYYTMVFERPSSILDFFHEETTPDELSNFTYPGNPLVYVSSVSVGRKFYLLIETTEDKESLTAAVNLSFFGNNVGGNIKKVDQLNNLRIEAFALGGNRSAAIQAIYNGEEALNDFLSEGASIENGRPVSYVLRNALTDEVVKNGLATDYDVTSCLPADPTDEDMMMWYVAEENNFEFPDNRNVNKVLTWYDLSPKNNHAINDNPSSVVPTMEWEENPVCSNEGLRITFPVLPTITDNLRFYGGDFLNSDYTLSLAISSPKESSAGNGPGQCYKIFSSNNDEMEIRVENSDIYFKHNDSEISVSFPTNTSDCSVFSFVYDQQEGMKIYANGEIASSNGSGILPLSSLTNPGIGFIPCDLSAQNSGAHEIYEILAYKKALIPDQIANQYSEIQQRHNL